ncbi:hypothetical protein P6144_06290 [Sphingomonas sp. HITSZ_GF]|uniref:hypothetical protein n=1 Tax=Sphingomonas sp. HITSZ_GF TaxID=3037247 RepID=UPI00240D780A|nr:hypothetical protein [Sphingomonas sp. HITSZ_GF]MDG2533248.1 hypothetical protein [Sphingomonas sp. HITSZ_GF]
MGIRQRAAVFSACGALLAATGCSAQTSDEQRFVAEMTAKIRQRLPGVEVAPGEDPLSVSLKGKGQLNRSINFGSVYRFCGQVPAKACRTMRSEFLDTVLRAVPVPTAASLRIAVRDAEYVRYAGKIVSQPIGEDLFAVLVSDAPDSVTTVPGDRLPELGLTRDQAWARAWQQTRALLPVLPKGTALAKHAFFFADQDYLASVLADVPAWRAIADAAGPELLVTVVADHAVFVARMPDGPKLEYFKQTVRDDCASQPRCISPNVYRFRDGRWVVSR